MGFLIILAILLVVVAVISAPLRREWTGPVGGRRRAHPEHEVAELEAARDAKYREIRDADLDHRTGKLSEADFEALDGSLRADAVEILNKLDQAKGRQAATISDR